MGYTNYWRPTTREPKKEMLTEDFRKDVRRIVEVANENHIKCHVKEYADSLTVVDDLGISETFALSTAPSDRGDYAGFTYFCFCKTYASPFDSVVKCCIVAGIKAGIFEPMLRFDGNRSDNEYERAVIIANKCGPDFAKMFASVPVED